MKRNYKWTLAIISFMSFFAIEAAYAQPFYKWVDDKGATHYTQTPPPQQSVKKVSINTHIPQDSSSEIKSLNDQSNKLAKANTEQEKVAEIEKKKTSADTERRNKNSAACKQIKSNLALLQSGQRLRTMDSKGERSYLTEDQKATQINQETTQIKNDCP